MHFDYTPLTARVALSDNIALLKTKSGGQFVAFVVTIVLGGLMLLLLPLNLFLNFMTGVGLIAYLVSIGMLIVVLISWWYTLTYEVTMRRFADANGLEFYSGSPDDEQRPGMIFNQGHNQRFTSLLKMNNRAASEIGNYQYVEGSGKNQRMYTYYYTRLKMPRQLPHIVLDAQSNNLFGFSNLPEHFGKGQELQLEGDFNEYFNLYAPKGYERDALYIFTPDVMRIMIDATSKFDCEIIDDDLYLFAKGSIDFRNVQKVEELMTIVDAVQTKLASQTEHYADERVGDKTANVVDIAGKRLKQHIPWWLLLIPLTYLILSIMSMR